jgi:hypothetical protein
MPAPAVAHSPAEMRRIAWSMLMASLRELDEGLTREEGAELCAQVRSGEEWAQLTWVLLDLAVTMWQYQHHDLAEARANAAEVALQLAQLP